MPDIVESKFIKCVEAGCTTEFEFTVGEQEFFASKGFTPPRRCPEHRKKQRARFADKPQRTAHAPAAAPHRGDAEDYGRGGY